jgi:ribose transport system permease protein
VEAAALTVGVALYSLDWRAVRHRFGRRTPAPSHAT